MAVAVTGVFLALTIAETVSAQRGRGRRSRTQSRVGLATLSEVQTELKMTDEQKKVAAATMEKFGADLRELFQGGRRGGGFAEMREKMEELDAKATEKLVAELGDAQQKRLTEIFVQVNGTRALSDKVVRKALEISDVQSKKFASVTEENMQVIRDASQQSQGLSDEERQEEFAKVRSEGEKRLLAVLSEEQRDHFAKMKGEELEVDLSPLRGRRGGGRRGGGGDRPRRPA